MKRPAFSRIALALALAAYAPPAPAIVGGLSVAETESLAQTTVALLGDDGSLCTGSLLSPEFLVTAAQCARLEPEAYVVLFGIDANDDTSPVREVIGWEVPDDFELASVTRAVEWHDIALVRFKGGVPASAHAVSLLSGAGALAPGTQSLIAGYGVQEANPVLQPGDEFGPGPLRKVLRRISRRLGPSEFLLDQRDGQGACFGDVGGPAFVRVDGEVRLWGVMSRRYPGDDGDDDCSAEAAYTAIGAHRAWLAEAAARLRQN